MKLLRRYLSKQITASILVILVALIGLQIFILFVNQLPDLGKGQYHLLAAAKVVSLQLPYQVYLFFPMASLLGSLVGLGMMANYRELVVMRAAGVSVMQITNVVLQVALILMCVMGLVGESLIPHLNQMAVDYKMQSVTGGQALRTLNGLWMRQNDDFIFIGEVISPRLLKNVTQFHFNGTGQLLFARKFEKLEMQGEDWIGLEVAQTNFHDSHVSVEHVSPLRWDLKVDPLLLQLSNVTPDEMTLFELYRYLAMQPKSHQNVARDQLVFWQRLMQPFSMAVMMLLSIPFIFGPLRSSTMGAKIVLGGCCGFVFYILNHILGSMSQVFQLPPFLAATLPTAAFAMVGALMLLRVR